MPTEDQERSFFMSTISIDSKDGQSIAARNAINALMNYLDRCPGSITRLKQLIADEGNASTNVTRLLESFEE